MNSYVKNANEYCVAFLLDAKFGNKPNFNSILHHPTPKITRITPQVTYMSHVVMLRFHLQSQKNLVGYVSEPKKTAEVAGVIRQISRLPFFSQKTQKAKYPGTKSHKKWWNVDCVKKEGNANTEIGRLMMLKRRGRYMECQNRAAEREPHTFDFCEIVG